MSDRETTDDLARPGTTPRQPLSRRSVVGLLCASAVGAVLFRNWSTPDVAEAASVAEAGTVAEADVALPSYQAIIGLL
jgi:hypothetical protein